MPAAGKATAGHPLFCLCELRDERAFEGIPLAIAGALNQVPAGKAVVSRRVRVQVLRLLLERHRAQPTGRWVALRPLQPQHRNPPTPLPAVSGAPEKRHGHSPR